ncbi:MAG: HDOD domain-containing protein [Ignavibacteria bacterium]|nr:MAG: HDOD domain-containing protein [Ignavibacteria bacterium]
MIAHEIKRTHDKEKTKLILNSIDQLAVVPEFLKDVLRTLNKENVSINEATKMINRDQSLVTKILRIANSPLYGLYRKVASVEYALHIIGLAEVTNIVTGITLMETFKIKSDKYLDQHDFWQHSYTVGNLCKSLCNDFQVEHSREAFVAGFLHDLGISVTHKYLHESFIGIYERVLNESKCFCDLENEVFGMNHQEIALTLLDKWNFPIFLCQAVLFHHKPSKQATDNRLSAIIHLADKIVNDIAEGKYVWDRNSELDLEGLSVLKINSLSDYEEVREKYRNEITNMIS